MCLITKEEETHKMLGDLSQSIKKKKKGIIDKILIKDQADKLEAAHVHGSHGEQTKGLVNIGPALVLQANHLRNLVGIH